MEGEGEGGREGERGEGGREGGEREVELNFAFPLDRDHKVRMFKRFVWRTWKPWC